MTKYGAATQTTMWIDFLSQLFKASVFDESRFSTIEIDLATHYSAAIPIIKDQDALNYMGSQMNALGNTRGKTKEQYLDFVHHLLPIFEAIETSRLTVESKQLYDLLIGKRRIPNPLRPSQNQLDTQHSILEEIDKEQAKTLTDLCFEIVRTSGGKVDISSIVNKLFGRCKYSIIEKALKIHSIGIPLDTLSGILIQADDYNDDADISIIEILLTRKSDGSFTITDVEVESKIHSLIDNASIKNAEKLLIRLVKDHHILSIATEYVASQDSETINALPVTIAKYAVSTFNRNTSDVYKDNEDFLILVLKQGNASQKKEVVRLMKTKINQEADLNMVVNVLDILVTEDQSMLKLLIGELDGINDSEAINDETKSRIAALATKLSGYIKKTGMIGKLLGKN